MSVYVDKEENAFGRMIMCHMLADTLQELHAMADKIGMRRTWFQPRSFPHYDLSKTKREKAISLGAIEINRKEVCALMDKVRGDWTSFMGPDWVSKNVEDY